MEGAGCAPCPFLTSATEDEDEDEEEEEEERRVSRAAWSRACWLVVFVMCDEDGVRAGQYIPHSLHSLSPTFHSL